MEQPAARVHLRRATDKGTDVDALDAFLSDGSPSTDGGRVGLARLLDDLNRRAQPTRAPGRAVEQAIAFDGADQVDPRWWPQGVTTSADASPDERIEGCRLVVVAWYAKKQPDDDPHLEGGRGVRITLLDLDTLRYRHVLVVVPTWVEGRLTISPLRVHAGGLVWHGPHLHIAATARGFLTCHLDDLMRVPDRRRGSRDRIGLRGATAHTAGYRYVLPVRLSHKAFADDGEEKLRYSFLSVDRRAEPPHLVVGEYARGDRSRRLVRFGLDAATYLPITDQDGRADPLSSGQGVAQMQGAVIAEGRWLVTVSQGPWTPGSVYVGEPGAWRRHRFATPMGPEDLSYWPSQDRLWSVTEHPRRRWIFSMRRSWFD